MRREGICMSEFIRLQTEKSFALVCPTRGMNTVRLSFSGEDILRFPKDTEELDTEKYLYGTPLLMPANRTSGASFELDGERYSLPMNEPLRGNSLHGIMTDKTFRIKEKSENKVVGFYRNECADFQFSFECEVSLMLGDDCYTQIYSFKNTDKKRMPLIFSLHNTFLAKGYAREPIGMRYEWNENYIPTGKLLSRDPAEENLARGGDTEGTVLTGYHTFEGHTAQIGKIEYTVSDNFTDWVTFNGRGERGLICIEPQNAPVNALNTKKGLKILNAGETETFTLKYRIRK